MNKFIFGLFLIACFESDADKLIRLKLEKIDRVDQLYSDYGNSEFMKLTHSALNDVKGFSSSGTSKNNQDSEIFNSLKNMAIETMKEADRSNFETNCLTIGKGDRLVLFDEQAKAYFAQTDVRENCIKIGKLDLEIQQLEKKLSQPVK